LLYREKLSSDPPNHSKDQRVKLLPIGPSELET
jgi:hypothetical protein